jgi:hypothetical protein
MRNKRRCAGSEVELTDGEAQTLSAVEVLGQRDGYVTPIDDKKRVC